MQFSFPLKQHESDSYRLHDWIHHSRNWEVAMPPLLLSCVELYATYDVDQRTASVYVIIIKFCVSICL